MKRNLILTACAYAVLLIPGSAAAFDVTDSAAYQVTDDTYLFTIEFDYGYLNAQGWYPMLASRGQVDRPAPVLTYDMLVDGEVTTQGVTSAIILSDARRDSNHYYTSQAGERETLTLLVVYQTAADQTLSGSVGMQVTDFAHLIRRDTDVSVMRPTSAQLDQYQVTVD